MGLSSSQARLLNLTARMHDIEYKAQKLEAQKLQMANESKKVYEEYLEAVDATKIQYSTLSADGSTEYNNATFNNLIGYNENSSTNYSLYETNSGKIYITDTEKNAYISSSSAEDFANKMIEATIPAYTSHEVTDSTSETINGTTGIDEYVLNSTKQITINDNGGADKYVVNSAGVHTTGTTDSGTRPFTEINDKTGDDTYTVNNAEFIKIRDDAGNDTYIINKIHGTNIYEKAGNDTLIFNNAYLDDAKTKKLTIDTARIYIEVNTNGSGSYGTNKQYQDPGVTMFQQDALNSVLTTLTTTGSMANEEYGVEIENYFNTSVDGKIENIKIIDNNDVYELEHFDEWVGYITEKVQSILIANNLTSSQNFIEDYAKNPLNLFNPTKTAIFTSIVAAFQTSYRDAMNAMGYTINSTPVTTSTANNPKYNFYVQRYNEINSATGYTTVPDNQVNSSSYLSNLISSGTAYLKTYDKSANKWIETNVATNTSLREVSDETNLKKAEAKYEADMKKIDMKDRKYDTELAAIDTERNAIKQEMETLKTVAKDNVERTFKLFG